MKINNKTNFLDGLKKKDNRIAAFDLPLAKYVVKYKKSSVLFSKNRRAESFFTQDSKLYYTPDEYRRLKRGERIVRLVNRLDSLNSRAFEHSKIYVAQQKSSFFESQLQGGYAKFREHAFALAQDSTRRLSVVKMWNLSIVGAIIFGMFTMTMIYRYLGQSVSAQIQNKQVQAEMQLAAFSEQKVQEKARVLGEETKKEVNESIDVASITNLLAAQSEKQNLEEEIREMVKGYPIEKMVPEIAKYDRTVAAFIIGIAKKESGWGVHVPVYQGRDCFNYWGYRGKNPVGSGGHTCFANPKDAVDTVAKRIQFLVSSKKLNTPEKMVIWKCGSDCNSTGGWAAANKWINDVGMYFGKLNNKD